MMQQVFGISFHSQELSLKIGRQKTGLFSPNSKQLGWPHYFFLLFHLRDFTFYHTKVQLSALPVFRSINISFMTRCLLVTLFGMLDSLQEVLLAYIMVDKKDFSALRSDSKHWKRIVIEIWRLLKWWKLRRKTLSINFADQNVSERYVVLACPTTQSSMSFRERSLFMKAAQCLNYDWSINVLSFKMSIPLNLLLLFQIIKLQS